MGIHHFPGFVEPVEDKGADIAGLGFTQIGRLLLLEVEGAFVLALVVARPEIFGVGGKALAQPDVRPVPLRDQIAPPLVGQFMGDQAVAGKILVGPGVMDRVVAQHGRRRGLHPAAVAGVADLVVLGPGIGIIERPTVEIDHGRGLAEGARRGGNILGIDPVIDGQASQAVLDDLERSRRQHDVVDGMGTILEPMVCRGPGRHVLDRVHQPAVGKDIPALPDGRQDFAGGFVVGRIETGKPGPRVFRPAIGVDLGRMAGRGRDEFDSPSGILEGITDGERRFITVSQDLGQQDRERSGFLFEGENPAFFVPDVLDLELGGIEDDPVQGVAERGHHHVRPAENDLGGLVEGEGQLIVEGIIFAVPLEALGALGEVDGLGREYPGRPRGQERQEDRGS